MSRFAICDNCGEKDDFDVGHGVFHSGGVVLQFVDDDNERPEFELELCISCRESLLKKFPKLAKSAKAAEEAAK